MEDINNNEGPYQKSMISKNNLSTEPKEQEKQIEAKAKIIRRKQQWTEQI